MVHSPGLPCNCCFVALKKGLRRKFAHTLFCHFKLAFFLTVYVFGACFSTLAVILVSDLSKWTARCWLIELVTRTCLWRAVDWLNWLHGHVCGALMTDWIGYTDIVMLVARAAWPRMTIAAWILKYAVFLSTVVWCIFSHVFNFSIQATTAQSPKIIISFFLMLHRF